MATPEQWADGVIKHIENPMLPGFTVLMPVAVIREALIGVIAAARREAVEEAREACALVCDAIADDKHDQFKGRGQHAPDNDHRADTYTEGESAGAELCADAIRAQGKAD